MFALVIAVAAAAQPSVTKVGHDAEERGRAEVADLLKSLCPEQCILLSVQARVEAQELPVRQPLQRAPGGNATRGMRRRLRRSRS